MFLRTIDLIFAMMYTFGHLLCFFNTDMIHFWKKKTPSWSGGQ